MPTERISASEAARKFSDLLNRARYLGDEFEIVQGRVVLARLVPATAGSGSTVRNLFTTLERLGRSDPGFADDLDAAQSEQQSAHYRMAT